MLKARFGAVWPTVPGTVTEVPAFSAPALRPDTPDSSAPSEATADPGDTDGIA